MTSAYCKAYVLEQFQEYGDWKQKVGPSALVSGHILYLHDNYVVRDGIFSSDPLVFDAVTEEWKEFCHASLGFSEPAGEAKDYVHEGAD